MKTSVVLAIGSLTTLLSVQSTQAVLAPENLLIYRVGDGSAALGTTATFVFLDEYTPAGVFVGTSPMGPNFSAVGNATSEGIISRSLDASTLFFTGYQKQVGLSSPAADAYNVTPRVVGMFNNSFGINASTIITSDGGSTTANTIRSATGPSAGGVVYISTSARVSYDSTPLGPGGTTQIDARNSRQVNLSLGIGGPTLYAANGSTAIAGKVQSYGVAPSGPTVPTPIVSLATGDAVNGFAMFDLNPSVAGDDTLYALNTVASRLLKYSTTDGVNWTANGFLSTTAANLTGYLDVSTGNVKLFLTTATTLLAEVDSSGFGGTINGSLTTLATAGANTGFRGIGTLTTAVPEPGSLALAGLSGLSLLLFRRQRK